MSDAADAPGRDSAGTDGLRLVLRALDFAARRHVDQRRKGPGQEPYLNHLVEVTLLLADTGGVTDPSILAAAALHDTVEDTGTAPAELEALFGPHIAALVGEVTDDKSLPKEERKRRQVAHAPHASRPAQQIKLADKISNLRALTAAPPVGWSPQRQHEYLTWAAAVVAGCRGANPALETLFTKTHAQGHAAVAARGGKGAGNSQGDRPSYNPLDGCGGEYIKP